MFIILGNCSACVLRKNALALTFAASVIDHPHNAVRM